MKGNKRPGGFQTFLFFLGFIILFIFVFALGVIVGIGLDDRDLFQVKTVKANKKLPASSSASISKNKEKKPDKPKVKKALIKEEKVAEKKPDKHQVKEVKKVKAEEVKTPELKPEPIKKELVKVETEKIEVKDKPAVKTVELDSLNEKKYVAKIDYNKQDFPETDQDGLYTVQLGSFQSIDSAYALEKKLLAKGYPCFVIKSAIPNKGTWYRVRVGTFKTKDKASAYAEKLKKTEKFEYTQVTLNK